VGYNGQYPGPTFEARRGHPIAVQWRNNLPTAYLKSLD
jgi:spore coat protein A